MNQTFPSVYLARHSETGQHAGLTDLMLTGRGDPSKDAHMLAIDAEVDLCPTDDRFSLPARLNVSLPGLERQVAQALVHAAHQLCPYSKATRGNIDVVINLV